MGPERTVRVRTQRVGSSGWLVAALTVVLFSALASLSESLGSEEANTSRLQLGPEEMQLAVRDPRLPDGPLARHWQIYVPRNGPLAAPRRDPKFNREFARQCVVRVWAGADAEKETRFYVHFGGAEDEALARRVAHVLGRLFWLGMEYLGVGPQRREPVDVWLLRDGRPGAEEFQKDIYLYAIGEDRAPAEWIREIAHEYSHVVLPPFGPFNAPERWANGYLGERLLLKWLIDNDQSDAWGPSFLGWAYLENQVTPLLNRVLNAGPADGAARRTDALGMEHLIGLALVVEATYGPRWLRDSFRRLPTTLPSGLGAGLAEALRLHGDREVTIDPRAAIPERSVLDTAPRRTGIRARRAVYWLYLAAGGCSITLEGADLRGLAVVLEGAAAGHHMASGPGSVTFAARVPATGWRRLQVAAGPTGWVELAEIRVRAVGASGT